MANYYSTDVNVFGSSEDIDTIEKLFNNSFQKKSWPSIRNVIDETAIPKSEFRELDLRGEVTLYDREADGEILISMEEIGDAVKALDILFKELGLNVKTLYLSVLTDEGEIFTNDPEYIGKWLFDCCEPETLPDGFPHWDYDFVTRDELVKALSEYLGCSADQDIYTMIGDFEAEMKPLVSINKVTFKEGIA